MTDPTNRARTTQEKWLENLGTKFVEVFIYLKGEFIDERHVADPSTLDDTVTMSLERFGARAAIWRDPDGRWCVFTPFRAEAKRWRHYPNREAAEMVVIHNV